MAEAESAENLADRGLSSFLGENKSVVAPGISRTETVKVIEKSRFIDDEPKNVFFVGKPIATKPFLRTFQLRGETEPPEVEELPVYAEITVKTPDANNGKPIRRYAIFGLPEEVDDPNEINKQFHLTTLDTEDTQGIVQMPQAPLYLNAFRDENTVSGGSDLFMIKLGEDHFFIHVLDKHSSVEVIVPSQEELSHDIDQHVAIRQFADEFPATIDFDVNFHKGSSYEIRDPQAFYAKLKDNVKGAWVVLAKELGVDVTKFPMQTVDFWASPNRGIQEISGKVKEAFYGRRRYNPTRWGIKASAYPKRQRINISVDDGGSIQADAIMHELLHNFMENENVEVSQDGSGFGRITNEGLACIGFFLAYKTLHGKMPELENIRYDGDVTILENFVHDDTKNEVTGNMNEITHNQANAILHWYLLQEKGGLEKLRELTTYAGSGGFDRKGFFDAYQSTYAASFSDLLADSKKWYREQLDLAA